MKSMDVQADPPISLNVLYVMNCCGYQMVGGKKPQMAELYLRLDTGLLIKTGDELRQVLNMGVPHKVLDGDQAVQALKSEMKMKKRNGGRRS
jgi:hypothetical protein